MSNQTAPYRKAAAGGLDKAATAIDERADQLPGGEDVSKLAHEAAGKLKDTARYVRKRDVSGMMKDLGNGIKNHPAPALVAAAAAGFFVGRAVVMNQQKKSHSAHHAADIWDTVRAAIVGAAAATKLVRTLKRTWRTRTAW
jgi:hypothetical protein